MSGREEKSRALAATGGRPTAPHRASRRARRGFLSDERGAVSIEFTTLVPFFIFLLVFFTDATVIYLTHTEMFNAARDISRRMTTGELDDNADVQAYAESHLFLGQRDYYVGIDFAGDRTVAVVVSLDDAAPFGLFFQPILGRELIASATMGEEPRIE